MSEESVAVDAVDAVDAAGVEVVLDVVAVDLVDKRPTRDASRSGFGKNSCRVNSWKGRTGDVAQDLQVAAE